MAVQFKYDQAVKRLEEILRDIESDGQDVDSLVDRLKEAKDLIKKCREKLFNVEAELKKISEDEGD